VPIVLKSGTLNLLEPSGPVQACNGIALRTEWQTRWIPEPVWMSWRRKQFSPFVGNRKSKLQTSLANDKLSQPVHRAVTYWDWRYQMLY